MVDGGCTPWWWWWMNTTYEWRMEDRMAFSSSESILALSARLSLLAINYDVWRRYNRQNSLHIIHTTIQQHGVDVGRTKAEAKIIILW